MSRVLDFSQRVPIDGEAATGHMDEERKLLAVVLMHPEQFPTVAHLTEDAFGVAAHAAIWAGIVATVARDLPPEPLAVRDTLRTLGRLDEAGGFIALVSLAGDYPLRTMLEPLVHQVTSGQLRRRVLACASGLERAALLEDTTDAEVVEYLERETRAARGLLGGVASTAMLSADMAMASVTPHLQALLSNTASRGLSTGIHGLDGTTGGMQAGQLIILAARPAVGKTSFALQVAMRAAQSVPVAIFSLEMSTDQVLLRACAQAANIDSHRFFSGVLPPYQHDAVQTAALDLAARQWHINDAGSLTVADVRQRCEEVQATGGLGLVVVDYLQLLSPAGKATNNRTNDVSDMSRALKVLAKDLHVPCLVLSQLSRAVETRAGQKPQLSDLRDSGAIEADADQVWFLHRDVAGQGAQGGEVDIIVAKNRTGPTGSVTVDWIAHATRFEDRA